MTVVFTTFSNQRISLCADKRMTNLRMNTFQDSATKIKKWYPDLAVGYAGSNALANIILPTVYSCIEEQKMKHTVEEVSDLLCQAFYIAQDEYPRNAKGNSYKICSGRKT